MMLLSRIASSFAAAAALLSLAACSSGPEIRADADPTADLSSYKTFAFFDRPTSDGAGYSTILTQRLKTATQRSMELRGYRMDTGNPQLLVNFNLNIEDRTDVRSTPTPGVGYYGYRAGYYSMWGSSPQSIETIHYRAGTLAIDVVDAAQKRLVWSGVAEGKVNKKAAQNPGPAIDRVVATIFEKYPIHVPAAQ